MACWYSPWPVAASLESHLKAAGLRRCGEEPEALSSDALIVYSPPDVLLTAGAATATAPPSVDQLAEGYGRIQAFAGRHPLIAAWRLEALQPETIQQWLAEARPIQTDQAFPSPDPVSALLTKTLLQSRPSLLEAYLDLELMAELAGGDPDTSYLQRVSAAAADPQALLRSWWLPFQQLHTCLNEQAEQVARVEALEGETLQTREEAKGLLKELHQSQAELKRVRLVNQEQRSRVGQLEQTLEVKTTRVADLEADLGQLRQERDGVSQERIAALQERDAAVQEKEKAWFAVADLQYQLAGETAALQLARDGHASLHARSEALEGENRLARQEVARLLLQVDLLREELQRLALQDQEQAAEMGQLRETIEAQTATITDLEADLARINSERDASVAELEGETQQARVEAESLLLELHQLQEELERLVLVNREERSRVGQLEQTLAVQSTRVSDLEADLGQLRQERTAALQERDGAVREQKTAWSAVADLQHQLAGETETLRLAREAQASLHTKAEALEGENRLTRQELERLLLHVDPLQEELQRLAFQDQEKSVRMGQLRESMEAQTAKITDLEADLTQITSERDARVAELEGETQQAREEAEGLLQELHQLQEELERLVLVNREQHSRVGQLEQTLEEKTYRVTVLEADLGQLRQERTAALQERDGAMQERTAALQERDGAVQERTAALQERDGAVREQKTAWSAVADLQHQLAGETEALRLAREAQASLHARAEALEAENRLTREEVERLLLQVHPLQEELERLFLSDHEKSARMGPLQEIIEAQHAKVAGLEAAIAQIHQVRDGATRERDEMVQQRDAIAGEKAAAMITLADLQQQLSLQTEALRLAQAAEADQLARAGVLEGESRLAREEVERVRLQVDHLQDELENFFLQGKARAQLVEAQHEQLLRAQFLISRLLGRPFPPELTAEAVAVEVLPTQTSGSPIPSLPGGEPGRRGWARGSLLRKLLRGG